MDYNDWSDFIIILLPILRNLTSQHKVQQMILLVCTRVSDSHPDTWARRMSCLVSGVEEVVCQSVECAGADGCTEGAEPMCSAALVYLSASLDKSQRGVSVEDEWKTDLYGMTVIIVFCK